MLAVNKMNFSDRLLDLLTVSHAQQQNATLSKNFKITPSLAQFLIVGNEKNWLCLLEKSPYMKETVALQLRSVQ